MAGGSFFKGWASNLPSIPTQLTEQKYRSLYFGHVLRVNYKNNEITVRLIGVSKEESDDDIVVTALPANLNMVKYPLPGEIVLMFYALENLVAKQKYATRLYYLSTITSNQSITYNSDPYIGQSFTPEQAERMYTDEYDTRFENKLKNPKAFIIEENGTKIVPERPQLKPAEGDVIIQGRFGSRVRLGSSTYDPSGIGTEWSEEGGVYGDPIVAFTTDRKQFVGNRADADPITYEESINETESSLYLCSSQTVGVEMSTSKLLSFKYKYDVPEKSGDMVASNNDPIGFVNSPAELAKPWKRADEDNTTGGGTSTGGGGSSTNTTIPVVANKVEGVTNTKYSLAGNLIVSIPKTPTGQTPPSSYPLFVIFGGINYATAQWMYDQMNGPMLSKYIVVCANYTDSFNKIKPVYEAFLKKENNAVSTLSIAGFSAGGYPAQNAFSPSLAIFGLIDPSTKSKYLDLAFNSNGIMVYNPNNWLGQGPGLEAIANLQPQIGDKIVKAGGKAENIKMSHASIPKYFFNKYCV